MGDIVANQSGVEPPQSKDPKRRRAAAVQRSKAASSRRSPKIQSGVEPPHSTNPKPDQLFFFLCLTLLPAEQGKSKTKRKKG
jgi:hypothetical protein